MAATVEISDGLLVEARKLAGRERTSVRALVEEGLRKVVTERRHPGTFKLRRASFKGEGLQPALTEASWERIRELAYEGRGA